MKLLINFLKFWYHFIVGDDYRIAVGVFIGFGGVALLVHRAHLQWWWLLPIAVVGMLSLSLWLETRQRK
jgi:hypothetical protein